MESNYFADAAMLIRKPVNEVFEAFINPDITKNFWFTRGSGRLEEGNTIIWTWEMYNLSTTINVISIIPNKKILIHWDDNPDALVEWSFQDIEGESTFVKIKNTGFKGTSDELIAQIRDASGGFSWVLAGLKSYLEHGINLNLIADRYPKEVS